jgi:putative nucleotidyltransferase with HDIG domain
MLVSVLSNSPECTPEGLKENISQLTEQVRSNPAAMISLAHLKDVDNYTFMHSVNVSILAILLAERLGLKDAEVLDIATGAILHDIGKMRVDQTVLNKPGKLTDEEFLEMKNHPKRGFDILRERGFPEKVSIIALAHHEKMNGNGYPLSIDASRIPVPARICAIVDIYDALTADRVYKKAMHPTEAFEILDREAGQGIDEKLLEVFHNLLGVYPTSSLVLLADGSLARVIEQNRAEPAKPVVEVLHDRNGQAPKEILVVDTAKNTAYAVKRIFKE